MSDFGIIKTIKEMVWALEPMQKMKVYVGSEIPPNTNLPTLKIILAKGDVVLRGKTRGSIQMVIQSHYNGPREILDLMRCVIDAFDGKSLQILREDQTNHLCLLKYEDCQLVESHEGPLRTLTLNFTYLLKI